MRETIVEKLPLPLMYLEPEDEEAELSVSSVVIEPEVSRTDRSIARRASLQILYELDTTGHSVSAVMDSHFLEVADSSAVRPVIRRLVHGVLENKLALDGIIQEYAPEFPVNQVAVIDRNILRMAIYEHQLQRRHTPVPVIINEAVQLARRFGAEHAPGFVHGVLGSLTSEEQADAATDSLEAEYA